MTGEQVGAPNGHATGGTHATGPAASRRATGGGAHHVTAVLVSHNGQEYLGPTLDALRMGRRLPDAMVVVDTGSTDASLDRIAAAEPTAVLDLPPDTSFGGAVAAAEAHLLGPGVALERMDALSEALDGYLYLHAARADMLRRLHRSDEARDAYTRALELAGNGSEQRFIRRRLSELPPSRLPDARIPGSR